MNIAAAALDHSSAPAPSAPVEGAGSVSGADSEQLLGNPEQLKAKEIEVNDPRFEVLSRLERKVKQKEQELAQKLKEIEEKEARFGKYAEVEGKVKENPLTALRDLGWEGDLETLNQWALQNLNDDELDPVAKRFKQIEETLAAKDQEYEAKLKKAIEEKEQEIRAKESEYQIKEFKNGIKSFLEQNKDEYELLSVQPEATELIYEVIYEDIIRKQKAGSTDIVPMEFKEAAKRLEDYLDAQLEPILKSKKIQSKFVDPDNWMNKYQVKSTQTINEDMTPASAISAENLTPQQRAELAIKKLREGKYPSDD
jgi:hypothetical protein